MRDMAPLVLDSVTHLPADVAGRIALCASHGGEYAGIYAVQRGVWGLILHDAGIGRQAAGLGALDALSNAAVPCACVGHRTARIGDAADMLARGRISAVNGPAAADGVEPGMPVAEALARMRAAAQPPQRALPDLGEARQEIAGAAHRGVRVFVLDSNGLVGPEDAGHIVVTGSHGGLLGGRPETAVKAQVRAALYNDAGFGADDAGISRLPALQARGIAGACVSCFSARIGEGMSTWNDGFVSALNPLAASRGGRIGQSARDFVAAMLERF